MNATRFARLSRRPAILVLVALAVTGTSLAVAVAPWPAWPLGGLAIPDKDLYRAVVTRVHAGENYYDVLADQLRAAGAVSVFNWRPPTYAVLLGALPDPDWGRGILLLLAALSVALVVKAYLPDAGLLRAGLLVVLLLGGAFGWTIFEPDAFLTTEPWCEVFILFSLGGYANGRQKLGALWGLAALALRELAAPYCVVAAALALAQRRRGEVVVWAGGFVLAAVGFSLHVSEVRKRLPAADTAAVSQWVGTGSGPLFVVQTATMNVFLRPLPPPLLAVYVVLAGLGLIGLRGEAGARLALTAGGYVVFFAAVRGGPYWGMLYAPVVLLGTAFAPAALRDLFAAARRKRTSGSVAATSP